MKRFFLWMPLLALAPLCMFLSDYFELGYLDSWGFLLAAASMFLLPWIVAAIFVRVVSVQGVKLKLLIYVSAILVQAGLFVIEGPGATIEMMGLAQRMSWKYPPNELISCAEALKAKYQSKIGETSGGSTEIRWGMDSIVAIPDSELPESLRGEFKETLVGREYGEENQEVVFVIDPRTAIVCDGKETGRGFFNYPMGNGIHAYHYERM